MTASRVLLVVAGNLVWSGTLLLVRRPSSRPSAVLRELPGGKLESGESPTEALALAMPPLDRPVVERLAGAGAEFPPTDGTGHALDVAALEGRR